MRGDSRIVDKFARAKPRTLIPENNIPGVTRKVASPGPPQLKAQAFTRYTGNLVIFKLYILAAHPPRALLFTVYNRYRTRYPYIVGFFLLGLRLAAVLSAQVFRHCGSIAVNAPQCRIYI